MYLSATVKVPEIPGKITRRKMGTNVYVLFEVGRVYDPKRQFNVPQRVTIGKLVSEADNTQMQPNEKFLELFPECRPLPQEQASVRSNTISAGTFIALDSIVREYKLRQLLDDAFGRDAGFILDLAAYMIVSEDNECLGRPMCQTRQLSTLPGYQKILGPDISLEATDVEINDVNQLLASGYFYE